MQRRTLTRLGRFLRSRSPTLLLAFLPACDSTMPSSRFRNDVRLPVPNTGMALPSPERLSKLVPGERYQLSPRTLIAIAFENQPDIKSSYQRFKSEEARYDFFVVSRDSLTPRLRLTNTAGEARAAETVGRRRDHTVELSVEKLFFDTTELNMALGLRTAAVDEAIGYHPFVSANLRYPLWVSREKLERTSEEIFRRNELNDAQLGYIQEVRRRLQNTLFRFHDVGRRRRRVENQTRWQGDLKELLATVDSAAGRDVTTDLGRVEAELARVGALVREDGGWLDIQTERLKGSCGLPFHAKIELVEEPFNPFEGVVHAELLERSIETDPEIATLRNEQRNAEVQLDLARRGTWDVTLLLDGRTSLEGGGEDEGVSDWSLTAGVDISAVDRRVTDSLASQAEARIARFQQAIIAREDAIFVGTFESVTRIATVVASRDELITNLPRFQRDFRSGIDEYLAGRLNIDDLLKRRETLFDQEEEIARLRFLEGVNIAELCAATGKFFELLDVTPSPDSDR